MKRIVLTGGGTAGHVHPNLALIEVLSVSGWDIAYMGHQSSIEAQLMDRMKIPFFPIRGGKWRRYWSLKNFVDPFNVLWGIIQAWYNLGRLKPHVIFSKGGFVAFPVVFAGWLRKIPVIAHESDLTPGLANRLSLPFVNTLCVNFKETSNYLKGYHHIKVTGTPIRADLWQGNAERARRACGFVEDKPCLLVMGGSQGARSINRLIKAMQSTLQAQFNIIHLCGYADIDAMTPVCGYYPVAYAEEALADYLALSHYIISRAGANSVCEIIALTKPHILIPLPRAVSRGDQVDNALYLKKQGTSLVLEEHELSPETLSAALNQLLRDQEKMIKAMQMLDLKEATTSIIALLEACV